MSKFLKLFIITNIFNFYLLVPNSDYKNKELETNLTKELETKNGFLFINSDNNLAYRPLNDDEETILIKRGTCRYITSSGFEYTKSTEIADFVILNDQTKALAVTNNIYKYISKSGGREEREFIEINLKTYETKKINFGSNN